MQLALVTTPESLSSGIGDYTKTLGKYLGERVTLLPFLPDDCSETSWCGFDARPVSSLTPKSAERILFQVGNERAHAFMIPAIRRLGGVVTLHDWVLFDLATAAYPELERAGWRGQMAAMRCGGMTQRGIWSDALAARKGHSSRVFSRSDQALLHGWHEPEEDGRWICARAGLRVPKGSEGLTMDLSLPKGHRLLVSQQGVKVLSLVGPIDGERSIELDPNALPELALSVRGAKSVASDARDLGVFMRRIDCRRGCSVVPVDLRAPALLPLSGPQLSDARFQLPFQRPIVRWADSFFVHSAEVGRRITEDRNAATPIGVIPHGVEAQAPDASRRDAARQSLGWDRPGPLIVSFGAIQEHKRPEALLRGFAGARAQLSPGQKTAQLVLAGALRTERVDVEALINELGLSDCVTITGWLEEGEAVRWMEASDFCVHLRGPSSLGTSGGAARALGIGRALILSDLPEWEEFPRDAVVRVGGGEGEVSRLADAITGLCSDPARVRSMESAAAVWAQEVAAWPRVADEMVRLLELMPPHRTARKSVLRAMHDQSLAAKADAGKVRG